MFTAQNAREATKAYYANLEEEDKRNAQNILDAILYSIKCNAEAGLYCYATSDKRATFKTQGCENRVVAALRDLGFNVKGSKDLIISWWENSENGG